MFASECEVSVSKLLGFETFFIFWMVSDSVSKEFGIEKSIRFGIVKIWYRKKYRIRYRKSFGFGFVQILGFLGDVSVSKLLDFKTFLFFLMVSDSVLKKNCIGKSIGFGFVQILDISSHTVTMVMIVFIVQDVSSEEGN